MKPKISSTGKLWPFFKARYFPKRRPLPTEEDEKAAYNLRIGATFYMLMLLLFLILFCYGISRAQEPLRALQIGDTIPAVEITNILGLEDQSFNLKDAKGKVLLLDFWSTHCSGSIGSMPHLLKLKESLEDSLVVIPVSNESRERIQKVWSLNPNLKKFPVYSIFEDKQLTQLFPHQLFPHIVWIDREGKYRGATLVEYANAEIVRTLYNGKKPQWAIKNDEDLFDPQKIALHAYFNVDTSQHFLPYIKELKAQSRILLEADSSVRYYTVNTSLASQYAIATSNFPGLAHEPKRRMISIPDIKAYEYQEAYGYKANWAEKYAFSYERTFPKGTSAAQIHQQLIKDLNKHFALEGKIVEKNIDVLELRMANETSKELPVQISGIRLKSWLVSVNQDSPLPWLINKTGLASTYLMPTIPTTKSLAAIQKSLVPYGLNLVAARAKLPMFYLIKKN